LNTILALSQARQTLDSLNNSASNVNQQLKSAADYLSNTQNQHSQALAQQQVSVQKINQANGAINELGNQISSDQQKLTNLNDLIAQIQAQLVQAGAMKQNAQSNTSAASISVAQAQQQV
jgi:chromosome segregation ATPase